MYSSEYFRAWFWPSLEGEDTPESRSLKEAKRHDRKYREAHPISVVPLVRVLRGGTRPHSTDTLWHGAVREVLKRRR